MSKNPHIDDKPVLPKALQDFLQAAAPKAGAGPAEELITTFQQKKQDAANHSHDATFFFTGINHYEWMIEVQIRQWNMAERARKQAAAPKNKPPSPGQ